MEGPSRTEEPHPEGQGEEEEDQPEHVRIRPEVVELLEVRLDDEGHFGEERDDAELEQAERELVEGEGHGNDRRAGEQRGAGERAPRDSHGEAEERERRRWIAQDRGLIGARQTDVRECVQQPGPIVSPRGNGGHPGEVLEQEGGERRDEHGHRKGRKVRAGGGQEAVPASGPGAGGRDQPSEESPPSRRRGHRSERGTGRRCPPGCTCWFAHGSGVYSDGVPRGSGGPAALPSVGRRGYLSVPRRVALEKRVPRAAHRRATGTTHL